MDGLTCLHAPTLLAAAESVGLIVAATEGRLAVRGPKGAGRLARLLLDHKAGILALLDGAALSAEVIEQPPPAHRETSPAEAEHRAFLETKIAEGLAALTVKTRTARGSVVHSAPDAPPLTWFDAPAPCPVRMPSRRQSS